MRSSPVARAVGAVAAATALLAACTVTQPPVNTPLPTPATKGNPISASPAASPAGQPAASPAAAGAPAAPPDRVASRGFVFQPRELTVPAGTTVTWTNADPIPHTVTADDRSYDSGPLGSGATFSQTFAAPGRYGYFCQLHGAPGSGHFGTIVVTGG